MKKSTKIMNVPRGTERARRRAGLHQGWKVHGRGPKMLPAKVPHIDLAALSTYDVKWSPKSLAQIEQARMAKEIREAVMPRRQKIKFEESGKVMNKRRAA